MENVTVKDIAEAAGGRILCGDPDQKLENIAIDSRVMRGNDLFVPIIGEKNDGHAFIAKAMQNGAAASLTSEHDQAPEEVSGALIRVDDTVKALQDIGVWLRNRLTIPLVGITGSVGKTTTREMVAAALSAKYRTFKTPANHNSQVGVPMTVSEISGDDEIAVLELGMSNPGEMHKISGIAKVDCAVMTNIGVAHIENLGSRENILEEKLHIQDGMKAGGLLLVNGDNDLLAGVSPKDGISLLRFGREEKNECHAEDVMPKHGCGTFAYVHGDVRVPVELSVPGVHNVSNALAAMAVAEHFGVDLYAAAAKLKEFRGFKGRLQISEKNGILVIDDTYNASPDSMRAALSVLNGMRDSKRRIAVLADMKELGDEEIRFHRDIGATVSAMHLDLLVVYGSLAKEIAKGAFAAGGMRENLRIESFLEEDRDEMTEFLKNELTEGDAVLFKGSNSMKLGTIAAEFTDEA